LLIGQRCYRIEWETSKMISIFGLFFACAFVTIALRSLDVSYPLRLAAKLASVVAFAALGVKLGVVTTGNLALARDVVLRRRTAR